MTVGTQLPFDRLLQAVDQWALQHPNEPVILQSSGDFQPQSHAKTVTQLTPVEWSTLFVQSRLIVAHAGMGTIIRCLDAGKPAIIMPRWAALGEHRNDHQLATVNHLPEYPGLRIVRDEAELLEQLNDPPQPPAAAVDAPNPNLTHLQTAVRDFINANS